MDSTWVLHNIEAEGLLIEHFLTLLKEKYDTNQVFLSQINRASGYISFHVHKRTTKIVVIPVVYKQI